MGKGKELVKAEMAVQTYDVDKALKLEKIAEKLLKGGLFPQLKNKEGVFTVIEFGYELGIPPVVALQNMAIIKGKIVMEGKLMLAQYIKAGGKFEVKERTKERCEIYWEYKGNKGTTVFTKQDAQRIGLLSKDNWRNYPEEMIYWRNVAKGIRAYAPDVIMAYTPDEITGGEIITINQVAETPLPKEAKITEDLQVQEAEVTEEPKEDEAKKAKLIKLIHTLISTKKVPDKLYRDFLKENFNGRKSSTELNNEELGLVADWLDELPEATEEPELKAVKPEEKPLPEECFEDDKVKVYIAPQFDKDGNPVPSLWFEKLPGLGEEWVTGGTVCVSEILSQHPKIAKPYLTMVVRPRLPEKFQEILDDVIGRVKNGK